MALSRIMAQVRHWGLRRALYHWLMHSLRDRVTLCHVVVRPAQPESSYPPLSEGREARIANMEELTTAAADPVNDMNPQWLKGAIRRGELCAAVFEGKEMLSYTWRAFGPTPHENNLEVHFDPRYVYGFYSYTRPDYRRQGLQHAADFVSDRYLYDMGYTEGIGWIETHNYPSLISQQKRGAYRVGYAGYLYLLGKIYTFRSPGARKYGFGFFPAAATPRKGDLAVENGGLVFEDESVTAGAEN
jgi:hypothetical protein